MSDVLAHQKRLLVGGFAVTAVAAVAGSYWNVGAAPYAFPMGTKVMLAVTFLSALVTRALGAKPLPTILVVGGALPAGASLVFIAAVVSNPESNNLWPIAVAVLAAMGVAASAIGVAAGSILLRSRSRRSGG